MSDRVTFWIDPESLHECDNCQEVFKAPKLHGIEDLTMRLEAGGVVPSGGCPECGALCYPIEERKKGRRDDENQET